MKETVESAMYAEAKETAQIFQNIYIQEKSELNTLKNEKKNYQLSENARICGSRS